MPRSRIDQADYLSCIVDFDDWFVSPRIFLLLDLKWGSHSIDRFAELLTRFDSRFCNPRCEAMDILPGRGVSIKTGFVRLLTLLRGL